MGSEMCIRDRIKDYTVYIDEVTSLLEFTGNDLLDNVMKQVVATLSRLAKHAKTVILSDAMVNDAAFELVNNRAQGIMIHNEFKTFEGTPAIILRDAAGLLQALKDHCNSNQPFLFGCDSCNVATKFYHDCSEGLDDSLK